MKLLSLLLLIIISLVFVSSAGAWYGAGHSTNWPNTVTGGTGEVIPPFYKEASESYSVNDLIAIRFRIENPGNNPKNIDHNLYIKIWRIENLNSDTQEFTESVLALSHESQNDKQLHYKTIPLGSLELAPGEVSEFSTEFAIENPGYYQFDLTDLSQSDDYLPGHIYAAGFLRIKSDPEKSVLGTSNPTGFLSIKTLLTLGILLLAVLLVVFLFLRRRKMQRKSPYIITYSGI